MPNRDGETLIMGKLSRLWGGVVALLVFAAGLTAADGDLKDKVAKGADGWYTVEFQLGAGKIKMDFPAEPKLESDPKTTDERLYSYTNAKTGRRYFLHASDGYKGKILPEKDDGGKSGGIVADWTTNDPRFKGVVARTAPFAGSLATYFTMNEKDKGFSEHYVYVSNGCFIHFGAEKTFTDNEEKKFLGSFKIDKGEEAKIEAPKLEVPAGWKEFAVGKSGLTVWAPVELKWTFNGSGGDVGAHALTLKEDKTPLFEVKITKAGAPEDLVGNQPGIHAMVPARAAVVTLGGAKGICTFKDGKPVGSESKFAYYAWIGNYYVNVACKSDAVSPADAEKVAALIVQQVKDKPVTRPEGPLSLAAADVPKGWKKHEVKEMNFILWCPPAEFSLRKDMGPFGDKFEVLTVKLKGTENSLMVNHSKKTEYLAKPKESVQQKLAGKDYAEVTLGGKTGACSFKDGKPVGNVKNYEFEAVIGDWHIKMVTDNRVSPEDAEKMLLQVLPLVK